MDTLAKVFPLSAKVHGHALVRDESAVVELHSLATVIEIFNFSNNVHMCISWTRAARAKKP
jgi:hypothetical protein